MTSTEKVAQWFEERQRNSELSKPSKSFLLNIYQPAEGQTEDELEAEIHRKDTEQMLKNSKAFYEKFLRFAENDFILPEDDNIDDEGTEYLLDRNPKCNTKYYIRSGLGFWLHKSKKLNFFQKYACRSV